MSTQSYDNFSRDSKLVWICKFCAFPNFSTTFFSTIWTALRVITVTRALNLTTLQRDQRWTRVTLPPWDRRCTPPADCLLSPTEEEEAEGHFNEL